MNEKKFHISVVTPVYKCEGCIKELYERLKNVLENINYKFEIIFVNDGSTDNSWQQILSLSRIDPRCKGINLSRNFGQHIAIAAGLDHCDGEWVVVMDCDLQDRPEEIAKLYKKAIEGYEIVYAQRHIRQDYVLKKISSSMFSKILGYLTDTKLDPSIANFGIYNHKAIDSIKMMKERFRYFPVMVRWVGFSQVAIPVDHAKREIGTTSYSFKKLLNLALDVMLAFSDKPLRLVVKLGLVISLMSFIYALVILVRTIFGISPVQGWPSLIVSIWFLSGLIIFILGIVGLYLGKVFDESKRRPVYFIKDKVN